MYEYDVVMYGCGYNGAVYGTYTSREEAEARLVEAESSVGGDAILVIRHMPDEPQTREYI